VIRRALRETWRLMPFAAVGFCAAVALDRILGRVS
jgi:hypothetical protein